MFVILVMETFGGGGGGGGEAAGCFAKLFVMILAFVFVGFADVSFTSFPALQSNKTNQNL